MSVYRCYSKKKEGFDVEAQGLCKQLREQLGIEHPPFRGNPEPIRCRPN